MPSRCKSSLILGVFGITYIQNVLSKFSGFLTTLIIKGRILQAHIDRKTKNLNLMLLYKSLNTYIDNYTSKTAWNYWKSLPKVATEADNITTKKDVLRDIAEIRACVTDGCEVMLTLHRGLIQKN